MPGNGSLRPLSELSPYLCLLNLFVGLLILPPTVVCVCVCVCSHMCVHLRAHVVDRGQLVRLSSLLLPHGSQELNRGCKARQQASLPAKPPRWPELGLSLAGRLTLERNEKAVLLLACLRANGSQRWAAYSLSRGLASHDVS